MIWMACRRAPGGGEVARREEEFGSEREREGGETGVLYTLFMLFYKLSSGNGVGSGGVAPAGGGGVLLRRSLKSDFNLHALPLFSLFPI